MLLEGWQSAYLHQSVGNWIIAEWKVKLHSINVNQLEHGNYLSTRSPLINELGSFTFQKSSFPQFECDIYSLATEKFAAADLYLKHFGIQTIIH